MLRNPLIVAGLVLATALVGLAPSASGQAAAASTKTVSVEITSLERVVSKRREDSFRMPVEDMVSFRVGLAFQIPPGAAVEQSTVILEGTLPDGTKQVARTPVAAPITSPRRVIECALPKPPGGVSYNAFDVRVTGSAKVAQQASLLKFDEARRAFSAEQVRVVEQ